MRANKDEIGNLKTNNLSKNALDLHLASLLEMNNLILSQMEQWCLEDRNTIKVIESKADRLSFVVNQSRIAQSEKRRGTPLQNSNINLRVVEQNAKSKEMLRTGKSWTSTKANWR